MNYCLQKAISQNPQDSQITSIIYTAPRRNLQMLTLDLLALHGRASDCMIEAPLAKEFWQCHKLDKSYTANAAHKEES